MKKLNKTNRLFSIALPLLLLPLCVGACKRPDTCHYDISVVNNSDTVVSFRTLCSYYKNQQEYVDLGSCFFREPADINPNDSMTYYNLNRYCLEETYCGYIIYVVPKSTPRITTIRDSIESKYNILKKIDMCEMGLDSLLKTNFTVYYP